MADDDGYFQRDHFQHVFRLRCWFCRYAGHHWNGMGSCVSGDRFRGSSKRCIHPRKEANQ